MRGARDPSRAVPQPVARWLLPLALAAMAFAVSSPGRAAGEAATMPSAPVAAAAGERCVEETSFMRRNHMELLKHHRDRTVREGVRTTRHSLANCVNCHADKETGSVVGLNSQGKQGFCAGCHSYVGVQLDCFECHATRPKAAVVAGASR